MFFKLMVDYIYLNNFKAIKKLNFNIISSIQYTIRLNWKKNAHHEQKKLLYDSKSWCRAETVVRCLINQIWLIE